MTIAAGPPPLRLLSLERFTTGALIILMLLGTWFWLPTAIFAQEANPASAEPSPQSPVVSEQAQKGPGSAVQVTQSPGAVETKPVLSEVAQLKLKSQDAFVHGRFEEAAAINLKIARKFPKSQERHYAVQMLGIIYENNLVDVRKAIKWNREFMLKYADSRQAPLFKEKLDRLSALEKTQGQAEAYKVYQNIKFANKGDAYLAQKYEALIKEHPDFSLKEEVEKEIAYAYDRLNQPKKSYEALQAAAAAQNPRHQLSSTDQIMAEANHRYWEMKTTWKWVAWAVIVALWAGVLFMRPWQRMDRTAVRTFLIWSGVWVVLMASRMPTFYSMETTGYLFVIKDTEIYTLAALNLSVLLWLILLTRGEFWQFRGRLLRWVSPLLTLVMTVSTIYLFIAYHPNGPAIVSVFGVKYDYLVGELRERML